MNTLHVVQFKKCQKCFNLHFWLTLASHGSVNSKYLAYLSPKRDGIHNMSDNHEFHWINNNDKQCSNISSCIKTENDESKTRRKAATYFFQAESRTDPWDMPKVNNVAAVILVLVFHGSPFDSNVSFILNIMSFV